MISKHTRPKATTNTTTTLLLLILLAICTQDKTNK
jgi:hypothetical protein